jgi:hypothetical protein
MAGRGPQIDVHSGTGRNHHMSGDITSTGSVQGASPVFAQRDHDRLCAALDEFESVLKVAIDDLFDAISDILPDRYLELSDPDEDEDVLGGEITAKGFIVDDAQARMNDAFDELRWPLERALRQLRGGVR